MRIRRHVAVTSTEVRSTMHPARRSAARDLSQSVLLFPKWAGFRRRRTRNPDDSERHSKTIPNTIGA